MGAGANFPCEEFLSVPLENGTRTTNGSVILGNLTYPPEFQFELAGEFRGCPCRLTSCLRICCAPGEMYDLKLGCYKTERVSEDFQNWSLKSVKPYLGDLSRNGSIEDNYLVIEGTGCETNSRFSYYTGGPHHYDSEIFNITRDGVLHMSDDTVDTRASHEISQYCLFWSDGTAFMACLSKEEIFKQNRENAQKWLYTAAQWTTLPFLILTFLVYWMIEDLRNIHGLTLMCYIACLVVVSIFMPLARHIEIQNHLAGSCHIRGEVKGL